MTHHTTVRHRIEQIERSLCHFHFFLKSSLTVMDC